MRPVEDRFWEKVIKTPTCWLWRGALLPNGYGQFGAQVLGMRGSALAHRVSYYLANGTLPADLCVLHTCDNRKCVNPAHLVLGTNQDNTDDMLQKGRDKVKGELHKNHKLTEAQVIAIRADTRFQKTIAKEYGISQSLVSVLKNNKRWAHLK